MPRLCQALLSKGNSLPEKPYSSLQKSSLTGSMDAPGHMHLKLYLSVAQQVTETSLPSSKRTSFFRANRAEISYRSSQAALQVSRCYRLWCDLVPCRAQHCIQAAFHLQKKQQPFMPSTPHFSLLSRWDSCLQCLAQWDSDLPHHGHCLFHQLHPSLLTARTWQSSQPLHGTRQDSWQEQDLLPH